MNEFAIFIIGGLLVIVAAWFSLFLEGEPKFALTAAVVGLVVLISILIYGTTTDVVAKRLLGNSPEEKTG